MNKNGFTLVELLAVIGLLAILFLLIVPKVQDIIDQDKIKTNKLSIVELGNAAKNDCIDNNLNVCNYKYDYTKDKPLYRIDNSLTYDVDLDKKINNATGNIYINNDTITGCIMIDGKSYSMNNGAIDIETSCE